MATLAEDLSTYLVAEEITKGFGVDTFSDTMPDQPDSVVSFVEFPSDAIDIVAETAHRSIQILVRDSSADVSRSTANSIFKALMPETEDQRVDLTTDRFCQIYLRQAPFKLKEDETNRVIYCFNIGITTNLD